MKKILLLMTVGLATAFSPATAGDIQQLTINGQTVEKTVSRITFDGDNVVLHFLDNTSQVEDMDAVVLGFDYNTTSIYSFEGEVKGKLNLGGLPEGTVVTIYDAKGRTVATTTARQAKTVLSTAKLNSGVYMIKAGDKAVKFVKK